MLGDDASMVFMELIKRLLEIVRTVADGHNRNGGDKTKAPKTPKIKMGRLSKRDFNKLRNAGMNFNYVTVPKEKLEELEKTVKHLGGSMFATKPEDGNNAVIAVPSQYIDLVNTAIKHITADILKNDPNALKIKDGTEKVDEADMKLTADVLRSHDIPVYSFKSSDGKYMNVVPDEFEGQYEAAMKEAKQLSQLMKNIEITRYEQTSPLDSLDVFAVKLSPEAAKALYAAAKYSNLDVQFAKYGDSVVAKYSPAIADKVEKAQKEFDEGLAESEKYIIDIKDNTITMNREKLLVEEDKASYFVRVPNTAGHDYLRLDKSDVTVSNDGKTLSMKLEMDKTYTVFDREGHIKNERSAAELAKSYNTKSLRANKDTVIAKYGDGTLRIELYNKEQNRLISLGIDHADKLRTELLAEGLKAGTVELLLNDIYSKLPDKYKKIFGYTEEKTEIVYADIPNIGEYLAQSQLSQQLIGRAECYGEIPKDNGSKFCFFDKSANKFTVLPVMPRAEVAAALTQMGYSEISAKEIADRIVSSYRETDKEKGDSELSEDKKISPKFFESNNPELTGFMYHNSEYGKRFER